MVILVVCVIYQSIGNIFALSSQSSLEKNNLPTYLLFPVLFIPSCRISIWHHSPFRLNNFHHVSPGLVVQFYKQCILSTFSYSEMILFHFHFWKIFTPFNVKITFPSMLQKCCPRTYLVVKRLRLHTHNIGGPSSIPGQGTKIPHATTKPGCR